MSQKFKSQIDAEQGIKITNELYDGSAEAGTSGQILSSTGSATEWIDNQTLPTDFVSKANGGTFSGALKITDALNSGSPILDLHNSTNGEGTDIRFTDVAAGTSQFGNITYRHANTKSYGSGASFTIGSDQSTTTILADGKLMYNEGIYSKPATGTGAGTRKDSNWDTAYTHSQAAHAPTNAEANVQADWNATSGDALILNKPTIPSGNSILDWTADQGSTNIHKNNVVGYINTTEPNEPFNPFGGQKFHDGVLTNALAGRHNRFVVTIDGTTEAGASLKLSNQNFEEYNQNRLFGTSAGETKVFNINVQSLATGSPVSNGITYSAGFFDINFYSSPFPASWSARVKNKDGNWTTVSSLTKIGSSKLRGVIPISNWLTDIEFTLTARTSAPFVTGNITYGISEFELFFSRMAASQGGNISSIGGYLGGTITTASGTTSANWNTAYGWGDHGAAGYLASSSYTASDVLTKIKTVDGSGSGLDADLLDGINSTGFVKQLADLTSGAPDYQTPSSRRVDPNSGNPTNAHYAISTFGNGGNVTGQLAVHLSNGSGYIRSHNNSWSDWRKLWHDNNDGSGSGLDADLLDGVQGSSYLRSDTSDTFNGTLTMGGTLALQNNSISGVNHITINDAGVNEGISWSGGNNWYIQECPDAMTNAAGNLQISTGTTRRFTVDTSGNVEAPTTTGVISAGNHVAINCAQWASSGASTGAIKITLPGSTSNHSMPIIRVSTYEYNSRAHVIYTISGHNWSTASNWYNTGVTSEGSDPLTVRLGHDGSTHCIVIGDTNTSWSYGHVTVELLAHPQFYSTNQDMTVGWGASQITSLPSTLTTVGVGKIWHSNNDGSGSGLDADTLDGQQGSYYAPINNTTFTGTTVSPFLKARKSQTNNNYTTAALWTESFSTTTTGIAFHISGVVGKFLEMRTDGILYWENQRVFTSGMSSNASITGKFEINEGQVWDATTQGTGTGSLHLRS